MTADNPSDFGNLSNEQFAERAAGGFASSQHIEDYIREGLRRGIDPETLGTAFDQFIEESLLEVWKRYSKIFSDLGFDADSDPYRAFVLDAKKWLGARPEPGPTPRDEEVAELDWPWPITEPGESAGTGGVDRWHHQDHSGLWICGYRVGGDGLQPLERTRLLNHFFRNPLPKAVERHCGNDYGDPGSEERLRRMANVIARNCRNFKRLSRERYADAIEDWEKDLAYLKRAYYRAGSFPWPSLDEMDEEHG
jgi:hypothetical protein